MRASCTHQLTQTPPPGPAGAARNGGKQGWALRPQQVFFPFAARTSSSALCATLGPHRGGSNPLAKQAEAQRTNPELPLEGLKVTAYLRTELGLLATRLRTGSTGPVKHWKNTVDRLGRRDVQGLLPRPGPVNSELPQQGAREHGFNHSPMAKRNSMNSFFTANLKGEGLLPHASFKA